MLEVLVWIEVIGFMVSMVIDYFASRGAIKQGLVTEEEVKGFRYWAVLICIIWWITYPTILYFLYMSLSVGFSCVCVVCLKT